MAEPLAYFLTWTTYGTRLHGDERLSVDRHNNRPGDPFIAPDAKRESRAASLMSGEPVVFSREERRVVHAAIEERAKKRGWHIVALNVRSNHVHCVVQAPRHPPERPLGDFKSAGTHALRTVGLRSRYARIWTDHGSTRWINEPLSLQDAIDYVLNHQ